MPLTGSRCEIRWLSGRVNTPTIGVISIFSVAVMEKCCDAFGGEKYHFRSGFSASADVSVLRASFVVDRKLKGHTVAERSCKDAYFLRDSCA
jgi:hypothetical protein